MNNNLTLKDRLLTLEEAIQKERDFFNKREPIIRVLLDNKLCKSNAPAVRRYCTPVRLTYFGSEVCLWLRDYDLPTVIDHVAGPFHQQFGIDWKLSVPFDNYLKLSTVVNGITVAIFIEEGAMPSCKIERVAIRKKTDFEREQDIRKAAENDVFENRVNCTGE